MARKHLDLVPILSRFPQSVLERIDAVLGPAETRAGFLRTAVANELKKRERDKRSAERRDEPARD